MDSYLPFAIEHKEYDGDDGKKHLRYGTAGYLNKGDYAIQQPHCSDKPIIFKFRGKKDNEEKLHPLYEIMLNIINGVDVFPADLSYTEKEIISVNDWRKAQNSRGYEDIKEKMPGEDITHRHETAKFWNNGMPIYTKTQFESRDRRKKRTGQGFERFASRGIDLVVKAMLGDVMRG